MNKQRKKTNLRIGKETYGDKNIEETFKKALEPYFNGEYDMSKKDVKKKIKIDYKK